MEITFVKSHILALTTAVLQGFTLHPLLWYKGNNDRDIMDISLHLSYKVTNMHD